MCNDIKHDAAQEAVAYLDIGAGGYLDLGSDLPEEQLMGLPKGRHALAIIGTYGIDGYVAAPVSAAPGIDFEQFRPLIRLGMTWGPGSRYRIAAESLAAMIDASPKGSEVTNA